MNDPKAAAANAKIRAALKMTKGARLCDIKGCQVITQGGASGLKQHRQVVHAGEQWLDERNETWQT